MKYKCDACGKLFIHPAIKTVSSTPAFQFDQTTSATLKPLSSETLETHICPFCQSLTYSEFAESEPQVETVYVYDLTSGAQTELAGLLAQGYIIKVRYAKQYLLEKTKEVKKE